MIQCGPNLIDGIPVEVVRKRIRRINLRVRIDGSVQLSVPIWWATLAEGEAFLRSKWDWVLKTRGKTLANPVAPLPPLTSDDRARLEQLLDSLHTRWTALLGERGTSWKLRRMTSIWGSCHWRKRVITYNLELARAPEELVEYVVVHELTHLAAHNHGPDFQRLMDERLPDWRIRRKLLNRK